MNLGLITLAAAPSNNDNATHAKANAEKRKLTRGRAALGTIPDRALPVDYILTSNKSCGAADRL